MARVTGSEESTWSTLSTIFIGLSAIMQAASMFMAVHCTTKVLEHDYEKLSAYREDHKEVMESTRRAEHNNKVYQEVTEWHKLSLFVKTLVMTATVLMIVSCFAFAFLDEVLFLSFSVSGSIGDGYEDNGLNNNVFNIIRQPYGSVFLALFFFGTLLHAIFMYVTTQQAKRQLKYEPYVGSGIWATPIGAATGSMAGMTAATSPG
eukprot:NODE_14488_length_1106_cov_2.323800.p1 GENE.NODE_14488_length_1106_cov_2.323800~~NODE_14488_length_1106_cov_2.323800.p1  ORF type:complete len:221 (+),score=53.95 NODE_14488_length_1106_cov_2.323800:50-664(+)